MATPKGIKRKTSTSNTSTGTSNGKPSWLVNAESKGVAGDTGKVAGANISGSKPTNATGNYTIGSDYGKQQAQNMAIGSTWTATDGSTWKKENDGTITVYHNGTTSANAYRPTDLGILGQQQMAAGLPWQTVAGTYYGRENKAYTTPGLEQYANDPIQQQMLAYINSQIAAGNKPDYTTEDVYKWMQSSKPDAYEDKYDPKIDALLDQILTREDFSYDVMSDPLYQQYAKTYQREGDRAMRNAMAEAAMYAGGMNSGAMTAAAQANNYYMAQLNDKIPELYNLAYQMYLDDKETDVQNLGILQNMSDSQYSRWRDTMSDWRNDNSFAYGMYQDDVNQGNWQTQFDYNAMQNDRDYNQSLNNNYNNNQWAEREWTKAEQDDAYNKVMTYIKNGLTIDQIGKDLIQQAGMTEAQVNALILNNGGGRSGGSGGSGGGGGNPSTTPTQEPESKSEASWTGIAYDLGLPTITSQNVIVDLYNAGAIQEGTDGNVYWTNGWNANNYKDKLSQVDEWRNKTASGFIL